MNGFKNLWCRHSLKILLHLAPKLPTAVFLAAKPHLHQLLTHLAVLSGTNTAYIYNDTYPQKNQGSFLSLELKWHAKKDQNA